MVPRNDFTESSHVNTAPDRVEQQRQQSSRLLINELLSGSGCLEACCTPLEVQDKQGCRDQQTSHTPFLISKLSAVEAANYRLQARLEMCLGMQEEKKNVASAFQINTFALFFCGAQSKDNLSL